MPDAYELVLPFDRDTPEFARGVEVGLLFARLNTKPLPLDAIVHPTNAEMALRLGEAVGATATAVELDGDWLAVTYTPR
jgi:hypothetical protein